MPELSRRSFGAALGAAVLNAAPKERPNILWLVMEDINPQLGCYGDKYAVTPNIDRFAERGMRYRTAWSNAPVCAPARTTLISGLLAPATGGEHMRSLTRLPAGFEMYPQYLRNLGYYTSNCAKEDYNLEKPHGECWDDSSKRGHWRNRKPGQPFLAVFNHEITHESQIRTRPHKWIHDPAQARVPAYHPDTIEVRQDWAQYYDNITTADRQIAEKLADLEKDGLADSTIVFIYGDNGSGMPRSKRWPYNSGLHVPILVHIPEKFRHLAPAEYKPGAMSERLISFVDLAPTLLSLAGMKPPAHLHGRAFLGEHIAPEPEVLYGFRGRMDERYDMVRSVRDKRYVYVRNYMPWKIYGQYLNYMWQTPATRVWEKLYKEGKLNATQRKFWETKPPEELYDLQNDPDEINNLAGSSEHKATLERLRKAQRDYALKIRDVGFLPEAEIHARSEGSTPYETAHDAKKYPLERILATAELASNGQKNATPQLKRALRDTDSAVRYWAALGLAARGEKEALRPLLKDPAPAPRIVAAEALEDLAVLAELAPIDKNPYGVAWLALNAIDALGQKAAPIAAQIKTWPMTSKQLPQRMQEYSRRLMEHILATLG